MQKPLFNLPLEVEQELIQAAKDDDANELNKLTAEQLAWMQTDHVLVLNYSTHKITSLKREESVQFSLQCDREYLQRCIDTNWVDEKIYKNGDHGKNSSSTMRASYGSNSRKKSGNPLN